MRPSFVSTKGETTGETRELLRGTHFPFFFPLISPFSNQELFRPSEGVGARWPSIRRLEQRMAKVKDYWKLSRRFSTPLTGTVVARCGSTRPRASQLCVYLVDIHTAPYRRAQLVAHQTPSMEKETL
jgi:hypothetical protein